MRFRIITKVRELYDIEAENEAEAYEMIALGEVEPITKKYFDDDIVIEGEDDDISMGGKKLEIPKWLSGFEIEEDKE